jgi:hypothetical protein
VKVAVGDVNADGLAEIICGTGEGAAPHVRIFNGQGRVINQFFAYPLTYKLGLNLNVADLNNDGFGEIIVAPLNNGGSHVRIFNQEGARLSQFFAYGLTYRGGVNLASGDVNGDGIKEIITGTTPGKAPHVRMFNMSGKVISQFFAAATSSQKGVYVSSGDINNDGASEIITSQMSGPPEVVTFDYLGNVVK